MTYVETGGARGEGRAGCKPEPFSAILDKEGLELTRDRTTTLQVNVGYLCNQECRHCHLEAGPERPEIMSAGTVGQVIDYAARGGFEVVDVTGGAPEMNPELERLIEGVRTHVSKVTIRSNLTAVSGAREDGLLKVFKENKVAVVASFPAVNSAQTAAQRGGGVYERSVKTLQKLNAAGYGVEGTGLELNLVSNPSGAFLPSPQGKMEKKFRADLERKHGITFNSLFTFANVPVGRFRRWLESSSNYESYVKKLVDSFNPCAVSGLMCRYLVSVGWDGRMYDCDFNLAAGAPMGGKETHISEMATAPEPGTAIATAFHCYSCAAGSGFT